MTTTDDTVLEVKRVLDAPPARVFNSWLNREEWQAWIGPEGVNCELPLFEPRVDGRYRLIMHLGGGQIIPIVGVFKEINAPSRLSFTWCSEDGKHNSLVIVTLRDLGSRTELTLRHEGLLTVENRDAHGRGWNSAINKLVAYLKATGK